MRKIHWDKIQIRKYYNAIILVHRKRRKELDVNVNLFTIESDMAGTGISIPCLSWLGDLEFSSLCDTMNKFKMNFI